MGSLLGIGRGRRARRLANQGLNVAQDNPLLQNAQQAGSTGLDTLNAFLGGGGQEGFDQALERFRGSSGFRDTQQEALDAVSGNAAVRGNLNSGATLRALQDRGTQLANQNLMRFLGIAGDVAGRGQSAANTEVAAATSGGTAAAGAQPQNTGVLGRFFGI